MLCVARVTRLARPTCRASVLPLEETRHVFCVLQKIPRETKGEEAEQGPKEAAEGAATGAEVSAGGDGGPAGEQVRVVGPLPFARHTRMVLLCLWNPPRRVLRVLRVLCVIFASILALLWRIEPRFPCSADIRASQGGAPRPPGTPCRTGRGSRYGDGSPGQDDRWLHHGNLTPHGEEGWEGEGSDC